MKYFLIYIYKCKVVDICSFDEEDSQMLQFYTDSNKPDYSQHLRYDSIQIFNEVR